MENELLQFLQTFAGLGRFLMFNIRQPKALRLMLFFIKDIA